MKSLNCIIGDKFGRWIVIDNIPIIKQGHTYITVQCDCGEQQLTCLSDLKTKRTTGCRSCKAQERSIKIQIGDIYKHWVVIDGPKHGKNAHILWKVQCLTCNVSTRWIQGNELTDPMHCFKCQKCAAIDRGDLQTINNGKVGKLTVAKYGKLKRVASQRNILFNVSMLYLWRLFISQKSLCAVTGDLLNSINNASLDRINSSIGYIEGNVQWVTKQANLSKHKLTMSELYEFCFKVLNHANQQPTQPLTKLEGSETNG